MYIEGRVSGIWVGCVLEREKNEFNFIVLVFSFVKWRGSKSIFYIGLVGM